MVARVRSRGPRAVGLVGVVGLVALAGCGGDPGDGGSDADRVVEKAQAVAGEAADGLDEADIEAMQDLADAAQADTSADARATVVVDGTTYEFRPLEPGPDEDFWSLCTTVAGSLQGTMQLVDEDGSHVEGGGIEFVLLEPDAAYDLPAEIILVLPDLGTAIYEQSFTADQIDAPASGRSGSGTFTAVNGMGDVTIDGTIEASC